MGWEVPLWRNQEAAAKLRNPSWHHKKGRWFTGESIKINYISPHDSFLLSLCVAHFTLTHSLSTTPRSYSMHTIQRTEKPRRQCSPKHCFPWIWNINRQYLPLVFYVHGMFHQWDYKLLQDKATKIITPLTIRTMRKLKSCTAHLKLIHSCLTVGLTMHDTILTQLRVMCIRHKVCVIMPKT